MTTVATEREWADLVFALAEACRVATPILGRKGVNDDEAWGAFSVCVNAMNKLRIFTESHHHTE